MSPDKALPCSGHQSFFMPGLFRTVHKVLYSNSKISSSIIWTIHHHQLNKTIVSYRYIATTCLTAQSWENIPSLFWCLCNIGPRGGIVAMVFKTSTKFVQKLLELNKGKHLYWDLHECVDYFRNINFLNHIGPHRAIQDNNDPYWTPWDHSGPYQTMVFLIEHSGPCWTIQDNVMPYGTNWI